MKRRDFINLSLLGSSTLFFPSFTFGKSLKKKHLILVELDGGNDGLNSVVPYSSKNYYKLREELALKKNDLNIINSSFGLNQNLENITKMYEDKNCAIINGLGYENPKLSHFKSIKLVETASNGNENNTKGWFSQTIKSQKITQEKPAHAFVVGRRKMGHLFDSSIDSVYFKNIQSFIKESASFLQSNSSSSNDILDFLNEQNRMVLQTRLALSKYVQNINLDVKFGQSDIEQGFEQIAKIVKSNLEVPVIKISQKGYDTHSNQIQRHTQILKELDSAIGSLVSQLKKDKLFDDVLIVTYSEFGRRVKENGSLGTDHGTASVQFVIGGAVKGGQMYGKHPSLNNLHKNNLIYTTHYRSFYNTILANWFNNKTNAFSSYENLGFI